MIKVFTIISPPVFGWLISLSILFFGLGINWKNMMLNPPPGPGLNRHLRKTLLKSSAVAVYQATPREEI